MKLYEIVLNYIMDNVFTIIDIYRLDNQLNYCNQIVFVLLTPNRKRKSLENYFVNLLTELNSMLVKKNTFYNIHRNIKKRDHFFFS